MRFSAKFAKKLQMKAGVQNSVSIVPTVPKPPWWIVVVLGVYLVSAAAIVLWRLHESTLQSQSRDLNLLSHALTDELDRGLRGVEEGLQVLAVELGDGRLKATAPDAGAALGMRAGLMPLVETIWLIGPSGNLIAASGSSPVPDLNSFLPALPRVQEKVTAISRSFVGEGSDKSLIAMAISASVSTGEVAGGWIVAGIPAKSLLGAFAAAVPAADARMAVLRDDGVRLAGSIGDSGSLGESVRAARLASSPIAVSQRVISGKNRLVTLQDLPRYGLKVVMTRDMDVLLQAWQESVVLTLMGMILLFAVLAVSARLIQRANRNHAEAAHALETQRARATKLESLGTLAGGVAHDFNNVLAGIIGYGEMAQDSTEAGSNQARHLEKAMQAAMRGKALVERILAFSRGGAHALMVFELEPVVEEVLTLLAASLRPGIILERQLDAHGGKLRGDPTQAFEAIMNLCTNAMQAMPDGGMVSVGLKRFHVPAPRVLSHSHLAAGNYLVLNVSDQGGGIGAEVMDHLFETFFTTRGGQSGTGLGLAVVHGVVVEFGGAVDVTSTPQHGASFTLYLPECPDALGDARVEQDAMPTGNGEAILVVDDDPALVSLSEEWLTRLNYSPVGYDNPAAALQSFRADPARFAAVITDEVMPGMTGTQLTEALKELAPALPVLLVTGYGGDLFASRAAAAGVTRVLSKPLRRAEIARALAEILR